MVLRDRLLEQQRVDQTWAEAAADAGDGHAEIARVALGLRQAGQGEYGCDHCRA